jgi:hypothetical protein
MTRAEFVAATTRPLSTEAARDLAAAALADVRAIVRAIVFSRGGTVPPPPWPAHEALVQAQARLKKTRDGFAALARQKPGRRVSARAVDLLRAHGDVAYTEADVLQRADAAAPRLKSWGQAGRFAQDTLTGGLGGAVMLAGALYVLTRLEK